MWRWAAAGISLPSDSNSPSAAVVKGSLVGTETPLKWICSNCVSYQHPHSSVKSMCSPVLVFAVSYPDALEKKRLWKWELLEEETCWDELKAKGRALNFESKSRYRPSRRFYYVLGSSGAQIVSIKAFIMRLMMSLMVVTEWINKAAIDLCREFPPLAAVSFLMVI